MRAIPKPKKNANSGSGWIVTFADLMSLLLTFFILLLSFSKMDLHKYEMLAQALTNSFGIAAFQGGGQVGGSVIFADQPPPPPPIEPEIDLDDFETTDVEMLSDAESPEDVKQLDPNIERLTENLVDELESEILSNALSVTYDANKVVVRFSEATTFPSGSDELKGEMFSILEKIERVLARCDGDIIVSGYTDDLPVNSSRYRSNWDLSAARAVSVVHQLIFNNKIDVNRVSAAGRAETNPLAPNNSRENRAKNRRVEISVFDPTCEAGLQF